MWQRQAEGIENKGPFAVLSPCSSFPSPSTYCFALGLSRSNDEVKCWLGKLGKTVRNCLVGNGAIRFMYPLWVNWPNANFLSLSHSVLSWAQQRQPALQHLQLAVPFCRQYTNLSWLSRHQVPLLASVMLTGSREYAMLQATPPHLSPPLISNQHFTPRHSSR